MEQLVYDYLCHIPKGKVVTYGQIAEHLGDRHLARWVGNVLHKNPNPVVYPCYKVVNCKGKLSEHFAFGGKERQRQLLEAEGIAVNDYCVDLEKYGYK